MPPALKYLFKALPFLPNVVSVLPRSISAWQSSFFITRTDDGEAGEQENESEWFVHSVRVTPQRGKEHAVARA